MRLNFSSRQPRGAVAIETLLAVPLIVLVFLFFIQLLWIGYAQVNLWRAASQAARVGAMTSANSDLMHRRVSDVMSRLRPIGVERPEFTDAVTHRLKGLGHYQIERAYGRASIQLVGPTRLDFEDWGDRTTGLLIAPGRTTDPTKLQPRSGVLDFAGGLPRGRASKKTILDASLLRIDVQYGLGLNVPVVGRLLASGLAWASGCNELREGNFGALYLGSSALTSPIQGGAGWSRCRGLFGIGDQGPYLMLRAIGIAQLHTDLDINRLE